MTYEKFNPDHYLNDNASIKKTKTEPQRLSDINKLIMQMQSQIENTIVSDKHSRVSKELMMKRLTILLENIEEIDSNKYTVRSFERHYLGMRETAHLIMVQSEKERTAKKQKGLFNKVIGAYKPARRMARTAQVQTQDQIKLYSWTSITIPDALEEISSGNVDTTIMVVFHETNKMGKHEGEVKF